MSSPRRYDPETHWRLQRPSPPCDAGAHGLVLPLRTYEPGTGAPSDELALVLPGRGGATVLRGAGTHARHPAVRNGALAFVAPAEGRTGPAASQLHLLSLSGGERRCISDFPLGVSDPRWLPGGKLLVLSRVYADAPSVEGTRARAKELASRRHTGRVTEARLARFWDQWLDENEVPHLFEVDPDAGTVRDLTPSLRSRWDLMEDRGQYDVSPDGRFVAFVANPEPAPEEHLRFALFLLDRETLALRCLTAAHPGDASRPRFSLDGEHLYYGRRERPVYSDRVRLARYELATDTHTVLTEGWDRSPSEWVPRADGTLAGLVDHHGRRCLFTLSPGAEPVLHEARGTLTGLLERDGSLFALHDSLEHPPRLVQVEGARTQTLFDPNEALLDATRLASVEERWFEGADGDPVQYWLLRPAEHQEGDRWPLVQVIHGGPYGVFGDQWHWRWNAQLFASPGRLVCMVNFHGSSSFGQRFADSILGDWGGRPAVDVHRATDLLLEEGLADPARVAVAGGSYGGYLSAWLAARSSRWACAVAHAAVFDFALLYAADVTEGHEVEFGGEAWGPNVARFSAWDPSRFMDDYRTPTLVLHGERDYRVQVGHGLALYGMLKARGVPARLVYYPDENHWILKRENSLHWYGEVDAWLERYLGHGPSR